MAATTEPGPAAFPVPPLAARLFDLARAEGYEARIVGGAVGTGWRACRSAISTWLSPPRSMHLLMPAAPTGFA